MRIIKKTDRIEMPWKNGGGVTFEIERIPLKVETYHWRLSQAVVDSDGPFSPFEGFDRWLVVWEGAGLKLNDKMIRPLEPYRFKGETPMASVLSRGAVTDIGLIFDRTIADAEMRIAEGALRLPAGHHYLISRTSFSSEAFAIEAGDTIAFEVLPEQAPFVLPFKIPPQTLLVSVYLRSRP